MHKQHTSHGYYLISIKRDGEAPLLRTNSERAFVVAQLQYYLSPRLILGDIPAHKQLASCIDLLAFSIRSECVRFLVFAIDYELSAYFADCIATQIQHYADEQAQMKSHSAQGSTVSASIKKLRGPHHALQQSLFLHSLHEDWEYDRYSSVGFYLHDRRGDWMRTWRLAQLYDNKPAHYRALLLVALHSRPDSISIDSQSSALQPHE